MNIFLLPYVYNIQFSYALATGCPTKNDSSKSSLILEFICDIQPSTFFYMSIKNQRRTSSRLATVMFRWTPCL